MSKFFSGLLIIAVGAAIGVSLYEAREASELRGDMEYLQNQQITYSNQVAELSARLTSARNQLAEANTNNDALVAKVQELLKRQAAGAPPAATPAEGESNGLAGLFGGNGTNGMSAAMGKMMQSAMEQQVDAKMAALKTKLNLTPEQEAAIRDILKKEAAHGTEIAQKMFNGGLNTNELAAAMSNPLSTDEQIKALLTPDQATAYDTYKTEEETRNARLMANMELMQIQNVLQLDQAQQDKVFTVLVDQTRNQISGSQTNVEAALDFRGQMERKAEALRGVLTPDQFTAYQKWQEQQLNLLETMKQGMGK
jgi:hypothetical protein